MTYRKLKVAFTGTWYKLNYAKNKKPKDIVALLPDGSTWLRTEGDIHINPLNSKDDEISEKYNLKPGQLFDDAPYVIQ